MSTVVRPRGPLPPKIYWRRRLLMLVVVVGVVLLVGTAFGGDDGTQPTAGAGEPTPPPQEPRTSEPTEDRSARPQDGRDPKAGAKKKPRRRADARSERTSRVTSSLDAPKGTCEPSDVVIVPDVQDTDALTAVPLRLGVSTTSARACTFDFGPDSVALQITSGEDLILESASCDRLLAEESVVARAGWLSYVTVDWSGRRGTDGCGDGKSFAQPGFYWAEAAAIGGEPRRSQFELSSPPPSPSPSEDPSDEPSDEPSGEASEQPSGDRSQSPTSEPTASASSQDAQPSEDKSDAAAADRDG